MRMTCMRGPQKQPIINQMSDLFCTLSIKYKSCHHRNLHWHTRQARLTVEYREAYEMKQFNGALDPRGSRLAQGL